MNLWQLRKLSTKENLSDPQPLPENWGPIFGLSGVKDKLGDLNWCGLPDQGWFDTGIPVPPDPKSIENLSEEEKVLDTVLTLLKESDWAMLPDVPLTNSEKTKWLEYRKALREIKLQAGFPSKVKWPSKP